MDRSKFKATVISTMKEQEKYVYGKIIQSKEKTAYIKFDKGINKIRIFPAHPDSKSFVYPYLKWWIPISVEVDSNGEKKVVVKRGTVFNAKIHGSSKVDIIEEYVKYITRKLKASSDNKIYLKESLDALNHWKTGLYCKKEWVCYVNKYEKDKKIFGFLCFTNGLKNKLNEIAITEDDIKSPIAVDPFTDPNDGKAIIITVNPDSDAKDYYKATIEFRGNYALTDDELEDFSNVDSLEKSFHNVYTIKDFEIAVNGLKIFDKENQYNAFENKEWLSIVEKLSKEYPDVNDSNKKDVKEKNSH